MPALLDAPLSREDSQAMLAREPLDVLIVGGGIVGAGVARDAALRGLRVGLVEQGDFASGTSSRSSRLLHGGIRYLAQGRIGLVREASVEKTILHTIAPHLAQPLAFLFPAYRGSGWPLWQLRLGVKFYDLLCGGMGNLGTSGGLSAPETLRALPGLRSAGLRGAVRYFDALTQDARLVLDTLRSAAAAGALMANYTRFRDARRAGGLWEAEAEDRLTGRTLPLRARAIVNATGPWADRLPHTSLKLRLTKGIHLVFDRSRLDFPGAVVIPEGPRILFVIPWGERVIVGTTDTDYDAPPEAVRVEPGDVAYLLGALNEFFPGAGIGEADLISSWAGVRPLLADPHGNPSDLSRTHEIRNPEPGWWDIAGGKLTTYRLMAGQLVDRIVKSLGKDALPCQTARLPLLPPDRCAEVSGILPPRFTRENVAHYCAREWALHLEDVMVRRTSWLYYRHDAAELARQAAEWMSGPLGWSKTQKEDEIEAVLKQLRHTGPAA